MGALPATFKAVSILGHYSASWAQDFDSPSRKAVRAVLFQNIRWAHLLGGFDTFITSLAPGFATDAAFAILEFRQQYPVLLVACLTNPLQGIGYSEADQAVYEQLRTVDSIAILAISPDDDSKDKVRKRDEAMVDLATKIIAWPSSRSGNTRHALHYAHTKGKEVYNLKEKCFL